MSEIVKTSEINFKVSLDENKFPVDIAWNASDAGTDGQQHCKAVMLSIWDHEDKSTLRIDLWTKDMVVDDMKQFFYESLVTMADTYERACGEEEVSEEMRKFAMKFGEMAQILKKK